MIFLNLFVFRLLARFISMSSSFLNFLCPMHTLLVSYLYLGSLFHTIEHKFCGLSTGLRFCVKATKFYYYYYTKLIGTNSEYLLTGFLLTLKLCFLKSKNEIERVLKWLHKSITIK